MATTFEKRLALPCSARRLFRYHAAPGAFARLTPAFETAEVEKPLARLEDGEEAVIRVGVGPVKIRWVAHHERVHDGVTRTFPPGDPFAGAAGFDDVMLQGPASSWRHEHRFVPDGSAGIDGEGCTLVDRVHWSALPGGGLVVGARLPKLFAARHAITAGDLQLERDLGEPSPSVVAVSGSTGLIGSELTALLQVLGHTVCPLVRVRRADDVTTPARDTPGAIGWHPESGAIDSDAAVAIVKRHGPFAAVVHLAGENIADGRLTDEKKARLRAQRVDHTRALAASFAALPTPPRAFVGACAVGFYGHRPGETLTEHSPRGEGFLSDLCADWEDAILSAGASTSSTTTATMRSVSVRVGIALSPRGGALQKILPIFQAGLGGRLSDGTAMMPAVGVDDLADIFTRAVFDERLRGPVNGVGPDALSNRDYTAALAEVLGRPALFPVPAPALRLALGELGTHVLDDMNVVPEALLKVGHRFRHPTVTHALRQLLGRFEST